jgi:hypothetical protein
MTARQLYKLMLREREITYTAILSTSARMEEKGFITRPPKELWTAAIALVLYLRLAMS